MRNRDDEETIRSRRDNAEGNNRRQRRESDYEGDKRGQRRDRRDNNRNENRVSREAPTQKKVLQGGDEVIAVCRKILDGVAGEPDIIFDVELAIREEASVPGMHGPVVVFLDAAFGSLLHGAIPEGFEVPLSVFRMSKHKRTFGGRFAELSELFVTYITEQPEWVKAKELNWEARKEAEAQARANETEVRVKLNAGAGQLLAKLKEKNKEVVKLPFGAEIMTGNFGHFVHESGVELFLRKAPGQNGPHMISVSACPEGHELAAAMEAKVYANRNHLVKYAQEDDREVEGRELLCRTLRVWLRKELAAIGWTAPEPQGEEGAVATEVAQPAT